MIAIFRKLTAQIKALFQPVQILRQRPVRVPSTRNDRPQWMRQIKK